MSTYQQFHFVFYFVQTIVIRCLNEQKEPTLDLKDNLEAEENQSSKIEYYKKVILPSNEEHEKHKEYLKTYLKKNYFN